jgi:hypothetical protein
LGYPLSKTSSRALKWLYKSYGDEKAHSLVFRHHRPILRRGSKKVQDYQDLGVQLEAITSPLKHVPIQKWIKGGIQELTANSVFKGDLQELRQAAVATEVKTRSQRLQKAKDQRTWDLEQVLKVRESLKDVKATTRRKIQPRD